jgi:ribosome maturation factor RimP
MNRTDCEILRILQNDGRRSFTGELLGATDDEITVAADTGVVSIAYADIHRSNLLGD